MPSFLPWRRVLLAGVSSFGLFRRAIRALIRAATSGGFFAFSGERGLFESSSLESNGFVVSSPASVALRVGVLVSAETDAPKNHALGH